MELTETLGVSLGTSRTVICRPDRGVVLDEASCLVTEMYTERVLAMGNKARQMEGRTPDTMQSVSPIRHGVISDYHKTALLLRHFVQRVRRSVIPPTVVIAAPASATVVERKAVGDVARAAGAVRVLVTDNALAAAIGGGVDVNRTHGQIVMDLGGGKTEISLLSDGRIVDSICPDVNGERFDDDIVAYVRKNYNILIGRVTAEQVKQELGNVFDSVTMDFMTLSGRDLMKGLPVNFVLSSEDVRHALAPSAARLVDGLAQLLERVPPELTAGIQSNPVLLCGGCSLIKGWPELISARTGLFANVADHPCDCVARGAAEGCETLRKLMKKD